MSTSPTIKKEDTPPTRTIFTQDTTIKMGSSSKKSGGSSSKSSKSSDRARISEMVRSLETHRVNTLTELCRIERFAASCEKESDAKAFQEPMTGAWLYYVTSQQFLIELQGLTRNYPFCGDIIQEAYARVRADPQSNCSWNTAWLCLIKMRDDGLIPYFAAVEAARPEMWGERQPSVEDIDQLSICFENEWVLAVETMLRHWSFAPTWY